MGSNKQEEVKVYEKLLVVVMLTSMVLFQWDVRKTMWIQNKILQ